MISDKSILIAICCGFCLTACNGSLQDNTLSNLSKLENLYCVRPDSVMDCYDLSGDSLTEFPDLSMYAIRSLDLSHNLLSELKKECLPLGLEKLDLSHNRFEGEFHLPPVPTLRELDLSYNKLHEAVTVQGVSLRKLNVSHNRLGRNIQFDGFMAYLDISYNPYIYDAVMFEPDAVDTLIREGLPLQLPLSFNIFGSSTESKVSDRKYKQAMRLAKRFPHNRDTLLKAAELLDEAIFLRGSRKKRQYRAYILSAAGEHKEAVRCISQLEDEWGKDNSYQRAKAMLLELGGRKKEADSIYAKVALDGKATIEKYRLKPVDSILKTYIGTLYLRDNRIYTYEDVANALDLPWKSLDSLDKQNLIRDLMRSMAGKSRKETLRLFLMDKKISWNYMEM